jgi:hypothetical protein
MRLTTRGRVVVGALAAVAVAAPILVFVLPRGPHIIIPDDPCRTPPPLQHDRGVTLQPLAMRAYRDAVRRAGQRIAVVQSYRSCAAQAKACIRVCGVPSGCKDACAAPGTSYHQLGAAIDVPQPMLDTPRVVRALIDAGWCQPLPSTDPGHSSFDGCH